MKHSSPLSRRSFLRQAGCAGMSALPLLNTLVNLRLMQGVASADTPPANGEYRALVCILLAGGNDSFNMLAPFSGPSVTAADSYAEYKTSRSNLRPIVLRQAEGADTVDGGQKTVTRKA